MLFRRNDIVLSQVSDLEMQVFVRRLPSPGISAHACVSSTELCARWWRFQYLPERSAEERDHLYQTNVRPDC